MTQYSIPGVYVDGVPAPPIVTALRMDVTLFVGPTATGPADNDDPFPIITANVEFDDIYGRLDTGPAGAAPDYMALAVRAFFANGGGRLYVARIATPDVAAYRDALARSHAVPVISIVAAPGASAMTGTAPLEIAQTLIEHVAEAGSSRFAIIDPPPGLDQSGVETFRAPLESNDAALYYPWVLAPNADGSMISQPPSGFLAGIYARIDEKSGVFQAPANAVIQGAAGFEANVDQAMQNQLNPAGINCLRTFAGRGNLVWGARTLSTDAEAAYINVRRLLRMLERSIAAGMPWTIFAPNDATTWSRVGEVVTRFLTQLWRDGALQGDKPDKAFFVRCDRTTMSQDDIDHGRLICLVGVAVLKPAEFIIFRVTAATADASE